MNRSRTFSPWLAALALGAAMPAAAVTGAEFRQAIVALHEQQIARQPVRTEKGKVQQYEGSAGAPYRYVETRYFDAASGRLISRIRRDAASPHAIHIIEVNVYDDAGRVVRDYGSIAPPWTPQLPGISLINLHKYSGELHSFRQFNLAGEVTYESCEGTRDGKNVSISLDGGDITPQLKAGADYRACFDGVDTDAKKYFKPF